MKRIVVEIDDSLHRDIKISAFKQGKTIKQYVNDMLKKEIKQSEKK